MSSMPDAMGERGCGWRLRQGRPQLNRRKAIWATVMGHRGARGYMKAGTLKEDAARIVDHQHLQLNPSGDAAVEPCRNISGKPW